MYSGIARVANGSESHHGDSLLPVTSTDRHITETNSLIFITKTTETVVVTHSDRFREELDQHNAVK